MGSETFQFGLFEVLLLVAGVPAMVLLVSRGFLRPGSLAAAPERRAGLGLVELLMAVAMFLISTSLAGYILNRGHLLTGREMPTPVVTPTTSPATAPATAPATQAATAPAEPGPDQDWRNALGFLVAQGVGQLPVVLLILVMTRMTPGAGAGGWREFGVVPRRAQYELGLGLILAVVTIPLVFDVINISLFLSSLFHQALPESSHKLLSAMTRSSSPGATAVMVFSAVIMAPVLEETIFRGLIQTALLTIMGPRSRWAAVLVAALIFAAVHIGSGIPWQALPGLFFLALVLGWIYERSGSLLPAILVHAGFNAFNTAVTLVMARQ